MKTLPTPAFSTQISTTDRTHVSKASTLYRIHGSARAAPAPGFNTSTDTSLLGLLN